MAEIDNELNRIFLNNPLPRENPSEGYNLILSVYDRVVADADVLRVAHKSLKRFRRHFDREAARQIVCLAVWQALRKHNFAIGRKFTHSVYKWVEFVSLREMKISRHLFGSTGCELGSFPDDSNQFKDVDDADDVRFIERTIRPPEFNLLKLTSVEGLTNREVGEMVDKNDRQIGKQRSTVISKVKKILSKGTQR